MSSHLSFQHQRQSWAWRIKCCFLFGLVLLLPFCVNANPGAMEYEAEAYRTFQTIEVDGDLNEPDWQHAKPINQFVQVEPNEGAPSTQATEVRVLYDEENIYFGFTCFDSDLSKLVANEMRRDARDLHKNDNVFVLLDTYNDRRNAFFFRTNALGAMQDYAVTNSGDSLNRSWDAIWECRAKINDTYWTTEISIPFSQLRFNKSENMVWGMNVGREIPRNNEGSIWVPMSKSYGGMAKYRTANLGSLVGLEGITPARNLEFLPYILPGVSRNEEDDDTDGELDIGFDLKYGLTSNLTADFTLNTDFAQVEADEEQVNLTRFSLFFPEKRPFFLEGAGLFDVGIPRGSFRRPPPLLLFYSRRIGIEEDRAIPIIAGGKITGKAGPYGIGVLNVLTDDFQTDESVTDPDEIVNVSQTNYSVLRVTRDILSGSSIGAIAINKQAFASSDSRDADTYNRAGGFDFAYRPDEHLDVRGLWAQTFDSEDGNGNAWYLGSRWRNDRFRLNGSYTDIDEDFNPKVGFVRRDGIRRIRGDMRYTPWPGKFGIRRVWTGPEFDLILNRDNEWETREFTFLNWFELESGGWISLQAKRTFEHLDELFEIRDDVFIPIGDYNFTAFRGMISTNDSKKIAARLGAGFGDFFNGERRGFDISVGFKPSGRFALESQYQFNRVELPDETFDTNVLRTRVTYSFSTTLFAKLFAQWNSDENVISTNFLLNYIYRPGSNFFLVFNQNYDSSGSKTELEESTLIAKMTYWWNP
ncbi:MAG: DUF5916 domain-containing protein [Candidatus Poribacteria bacterium]|nr:DUF5916 domain-containing protein [Candidatus Poribacteria bacterium]